MIDLTICEHLCKVRIVHKTIELSMFPKLEDYNTSVYHVWLGSGECLDIKMRLDRLVLNVHGQICTVFLTCCQQLSILERLNVNGDDAYAPLSFNPSKMYIR